MYNPSRRAVAACRFAQASQISKTHFTRLSLLSLSSRHFTTSLTRQDRGSYGSGAPRRAGGFFATQRSERGEAPRKRFDHGEAPGFPTRARYGGVAQARRIEEEEEDDRPTPTSLGDDLAPTSNDGPVYTKFQELADAGLVHRSVIREITQGMGHETMTAVQTLTVNEALKGRDTIAQARTGTGKTLGFLIPVVQQILNTSPELAQPPRRYDRAMASDIRAIIIAPARELAEQIAVEAKKITGGTGVKVQVAVGGNSKTAMLRQMQREGCHLLVATPGRLKDLLTDPYSKVSAPKLSALVLDEADRLLDQGFAEDIDDIVDLLPDTREQDRQTLLFSATVPREVMGLVRRHLKPDFQFVQTIQEGEQMTHEKIPQKVVDVGGLENITPALVELCKREIEKSNADTSSPPFKAIVYFNSTSNVALAAEIFENLAGLPGPSGGFRRHHPLDPAKLFQMHSKLSQERRTRVSERFRQAKSAIMFSSDVTARGMDFPNVTHVIQVGLPPSKEQYIHRVGRTGRAGKEGEGWLLLPSVERRFVDRRDWRDLPLVADNTLEAAKVDMSRDASLSQEIAGILQMVMDATKLVDKQTKADAYKGMIGTMSRVTDTQKLADALNNWTKFGWGWDRPPAVSAGTVRKFLAGARGVVIGSDRSDEQEDGERGRDRGNRFPQRGGRGGSSGFGGRSSSMPARSSGFGGRDRGDRFGSGDRDGGDRFERRLSFGNDRGDRGDRGDRRGGFSSKRDDRRGFERSSY